MSILRNRIKRVRKRINNDPWEYDKNGRAIVEINVYDAEALMSNFDSEGKEVLSKESAEFIDNAIKGLPRKKDIHLYVACQDYNKKKEQEYRNAIVNYYVNEFADKDIKLRSNWFWSTILLLISFAGFALMHLLHLDEVLYTISYLLDIGFWVLAWEAVDIMVLQQRELRDEQKKDLKIIFSTITFNKLEYEEDSEEEK